MPEVYKEDGNRLFDALFAAYARMIKENEDGLLTFQDDAESAHKVMDMVQIHEWAHGFVSGSFLRQSTWGMDIFPLDATTTEKEAALTRLLPIAVAKLKKHANVVRDKKRELKADNYPVTPLPRLEEKTGRDDPYPCGSGAKYKKCCGK